MLRRLTPAVAVLALVAGCAGDEPPPLVTFAAGSGSAVAHPTQYCDLELTECTADPAAPVELAVPPGTPVRITVAPEIAESPWQVVYSYTDATGTPIDERSAVFAPAERSDWTLELAADNRLETAEVQQYGPPPQENPQTGEIEFPIRASWVLTPVG